MRRADTDSEVDRTAPGNSYKSKRPVERLLDNSIVSLGETIALPLNVSLSLGKQGDRRDSHSPAERPGPLNERGLGVVAH